MTSALDQVIESLRDELQQYGEMLALFETQSDLAVRQEASSVLTWIAAISCQGSILEIAQRNREASHRRLAALLSHRDSGPFQELVPFLPRVYRPLVMALIQETNQLVERVRERAQLNHEQLQRSLELMELFISVIEREALFVEPRISSNAVQLALAKIA